MVLKPLWVVIFLIAVSTPQAFADLYVSAGPTWEHFVFEPIQAEETKAYHGYGGRASAGYSWNRMVDVGAYGNYAPGHLKSPTFNSEDSRLWHVGGEVGFRALRVLTLGGRSGSGRYRLKNQHDEQEISGQWDGFMTQGYVGVLLPVSKVSFWAATMSAGQGGFVVRGDTNSASKMRKLTQISLSLAFVYNGGRALL
jgi:hypothetical protein